MRRWRSSASRGNAIFVVGGPRAFPSSCCADTLSPTNSSRRRFTWRGIGRVRPHSLIADWDTRKCPAKAFWVLALRIASLTNSLSVKSDPFVYLMIDILLLTLYLISDIL